MKERSPVKDSAEDHILIAVGVGGLVVAGYMLFEVAGYAAPRNWVPTIVVAVAAGFLLLLGVILRAGKVAAGRR